VEPPGAWEEFLSKKNAALLGCDFVTAFDDKYIWEVGKEFVMADFNDLSLHMAGVFTPSDPTYKSVILTGRIFLQEVEERRGVANQVFVKVDDRVNTKTAVTAINNMQGYPKDIRAEPAQMALDQAIDDLNDMLRYAGYVILFTSLVILLCIANTISMSVRDRFQEIGTLRSIGFGKPRIMSLVIAESVLLSLLGGTVGCLAAFILVNITNQDFVMRGYTIPVAVRPVLLATGIGASLVVGFVGGLIPALGASRLDIVESLKRAD